jgi:hypothetical protein
MRADVHRETHEQQARARGGGQAGRGRRTHRLWRARRTTTNTGEPHQSTSGNVSPNPTAPSHPATPQWALAFNPRQHPPRHPVARPAATRELSRTRCGRETMALTPHDDGAAPRDGASSAPNGSADRSGALYVPHRVVPHAPPRVERGSQLGGGPGNPAGQAGDLVALRYVFIHLYDIIRHFGRNVRKASLDGWIFAGPGLDAVDYRATSRECTRRDATRHEGRVHLQRRARGLGLAVQVVHLLAVQLHEGRLDEEVEGACQGRTALLRQEVA